MSADADVIELILGRLSRWWGGEWGVAVVERGGNSLFMIFRNGVQLWKLIKTRGRNKSFDNLFILSF